MSATHLLNENWFYALECEAALKSTSLAPFAARPASQFKHFKRAANLAYFDMCSESKEKNQISEPATPAEAIPHFKVIPLGDNQQRHASLNLPTSTPSHIPAEEHDEYHPFPLPVIASGWWPPSPTPTSPNIEDADDLGLTRTPPAKSRYMDGLFSPSSITTPSSPSPSPEPSRSASSDDEIPCNRNTLRRSSAPAVESSIAVSEDHRPKLLDKDEAALDVLQSFQRNSPSLSPRVPQPPSSLASYDSGSLSTNQQNSESTINWLWQRSNSIGPRTHLGPSVRTLNHPSADTALKQPASMVSYDKQWQLEQVIDVIVDALMDRESEWTLMAQLWQEVREVEPSLTQSWIKEAFRDNAGLQQKGSGDGRMCAYAPSSDTDYYDRMKRIRTRRAARIARD